MSKNKVFAFDLGKGSMGICVREGDEIKELKSLIINADYASVEEYSKRRRAKRTRDAHKAREKFLNEIWQRAGFEPLASNDSRLLREFPKKNDETIYTSCLLRIALMQNMPLEEWQIYKALHSAIQRRGYDENLAWKRGRKLNNTDNNEQEQKEKTKEEKDDEENKKDAAAYTQALNELITDKNYHYPCYFDAVVMGLWSCESPEKFSLRIDHNAEPARTAGRVAPRELVENELRILFDNAKKQIANLQNIDTNEFLYGEGKMPYASWEKPEFRKHMGKEWDRQGVLSQKIPRFNNRIISKCVLMPKRNVCKANSDENADYVVLMYLKNLRYTDINGERKSLTADQLKRFFDSQKEYIKDKHKLDRREIVQFLKNEGNYKPPKKMEFEEIKARNEGRSSFCRPALKILKALILSGKSPLEFDIEPYIENGNNNPVTKEEIETMLSRLGDCWENIHIGDDRNEELVRAYENSEAEIAKVIGSCNNPIVRHRLTWFYNELKRLEKEHGKPDNLIIEFVRDGDKNSFAGKKRIEKYNADNTKNNKENKLLEEDLKRVFQKELKDIPKGGLERMRLWKSQDCRCIYTGENINVHDIFDKCQVDHIAPVSQGGNDAVYNKVLCLNTANQEKRERTPYQWLKENGNKETWHEFLSRVQGLKDKLGRKKVELLLSDNADELIESYNALAETAYIARLAQKIASLHFKWGMQVEDSKRKIFVSNGLETSKIRNVYGLNKFLGDDAKKNRDNPKHHALDAVCISYSREFKAVQKRDGRYKWEVEGLNPEYIEEELKKVIPKTIKRNKSELALDATIYAKRIKIENDCEKVYVLTNKQLFEIGYKTEKSKKKFDLKRLNEDIEKIWDETIKGDLKTKINEYLTEEEWKELIKDYRHPARKSKVEKLKFVVPTKEKEAKFDTNGRERIGELLDLGKGKTKGQYRKGKQHKYQIIFYNTKGTPKVQPVYTNQSLMQVKRELKEQGAKLYKNGMKFYSSCIVSVPKDFKDSKGEIHKAGKYTNLSIEKDGPVTLKNPDGQKVETRVPKLVEAKFEICKN